MKRKIVHSNTALLSWW